MLCEQDAVAIYQTKIALLHEISLAISSRKQVSSLWGQTGPVSKRFGVSSRTVKYIWNRQTWAHATNHLWPNEDMLCMMISSRRETLARASALQVLQKCPPLAFITLADNFWNRPKA